MRVDWAIACRYCEIHDGLATIVGAGIDTWTVPEFPAAIATAMVVRLAGADLPGEHQLSTVVHGPDMEPISGPVSATFTAGPNPAIEPGWESAVVIPTVVQFMAPEPGIFTITIGVDGRSTTLPVIVKRPPPPG